jgi:hypothetical protein
MEEVDNIKGQDSDGGNKNLPQKSQFLVYEAENGQIKIDVRLENETVWLNQPLMAELFQTTQQNISLHLHNIYEEGELQQASTHKEFLSVRREGAREVSRSLDFYKLDAFMNLNERDILTHSGTISHEMAKEVAEGEYDKFHAQRIAESTKALSDFDKTVKRLGAGKKAGKTSSVPKR